MQKIFFKNSFWERISAVLEMPKQHNPPLAILCHGILGSRKSQYIIDLSQELKEKEIASLALDFDAHGESSGSISTTSVSRWTDDLEKAFEAVKKIKHVDSSRIGLFGYSLGAMASVLVAGKTKPSCIVVGGTVVDFEKVKWGNFHSLTPLEWKKKGFAVAEGKKIPYSFFEDGKSKNVLEEAKLIKCPTLVIHGEKETIVPLEQGKKLFNALQCKKSFEIIKGADHSGFSEHQYNHFISKTVGWLEQHLK